MNTELEQKIIKDLEKSGFSTELKVRRSLINAGWSVNAGYGYFDKDEDKSREIDIVATNVENLRHGGKTYMHSEFHICGEIKKSEKPWVVFDQNTHPSLLSCAWSNLISVINLPTSPTKMAQCLSEHSLIKLNGWLASGIHEAFKNPDQPSRWYSSFVSVSKASDYYLEHIAPEGEKQTDDILNNSCEVHFVQPLVVLNAPLFRAVMLDNGEIEITEIESAAFKFDYKSKNYENDSFRVDLVTLEGLERYIESVKQRQKSFCKKIEKEAKLA
ncbi:hypothetical protein [Plesiomonas shigelloides]|uniref:hypothetical protein n=1 Tax=Plesiomonas shigelloides TaxID=703 RepID=UPI001E3D8403|nr:hypothetical protein [Plesiomonas shigelloides]